MNIEKKKFMVLAEVENFMHRLIKKVQKYNPKRRNKS